MYDALHAANLDDRLLAYKYLDKLPEIANGQASKVWFVPSDLTSVATSLAQVVRGKD